MKNLLSLYQTELQSTQDVIGVSQQLTLKGAQLVKLFGTVGAHARNQIGSCIVLNVEFSQKWTRIG